jgi:aromatic ring-cleaving dioxygenase
MQSQDAPFHAHVYYTPETREAAVALHSRLLSAMTIDRSSGLIFVGQLRDYKVGPHDEPQFEVHFLEADLNKIVPVLKSSG